MQTLGSTTTTGTVIVAVKFIIVFMNIYQQHHGHHNLSCISPLSSTSRLHELNHHHQQYLPSFPYTFIGSQISVPNLGGFQDEIRHRRDFLSRIFSINSGPFTHRGLLVFPSVCFFSILTKQRKNRTTTVILIATNDQNTTIDIFRPKAFTATSHQARFQRHHLLLLLLVLMFDYSHYYFN